MSPGTPHTPPRGATPRVLVASAAASLGEDAVVDWCERLIAGAERPDDPNLAWLGAPRTGHAIGGVCGERVGCSMSGMIASSRPWPQP